MNLYDFAIGKELEGEAFYRTLAARTGNPGLQQIFTLLADEEHKHMEQLQHLRRNDPQAQEANAPSLHTTQGIFRHLLESLELQHMPSNELGFFRQALEAELRSENLYSTHASEATSPKARALFQRLAEEERMHYALVSGILQLMESCTTPST